MPVITNIEDLRVLAKARAAHVFTTTPIPARGPRAPIAAMKPIFRASSFASALRSTWRNPPRKRLWWGRSRRCQWLSRRSG